MRSKSLSLGKSVANLFVYGTTHAFVDGICAAVVFSILKEQLVGIKEFITIVILYNVLAFGLQTIVGIFTDYIKWPKGVTLLGCIFTGASALTFLSFPTLAIILAGFGNALFHVGGGSICLNITPKKASAPGIFVAPGALGLLLGTLLGKSGHINVWLSVLILVIVCLLIIAVKTPEIDYEKEQVKNRQYSTFLLVLILTWSSILIRSLVGVILVYPWKSDIYLLIIVTLAIVLGKGFGGILADKFSWNKVGVGSLLLSIPFLILGTNIPLLGIIGVFIFNITMPITLVIIANMLPGRPGFAFGLTCFALLIGALPVLIGIK